MTFAGILLLLKFLYDEGQIKAPCKVAVWKMKRVTENTTETNLGGKLV
jgi:hypothetical protein